MEEVKALLKQAVAVVARKTVDIDLIVPEEQFGDYSTNVALKLAKKLNQNPRELAEKVLENISADSRIAKAEIAGPGFINLTLTDVAIVKIAQTTPRQSLKGKVAVAEYSDPNPFKALHAGHLYTTIVGDSIASLLERAGATVHRINYGGDVGLHVGAAMWAILKFLGGEHPAKLSDVPPNKRPEWLSERYVEGNTAYQNDEVAKQEIIETNKKVYQLHADKDHESAFAQIYWTCRQWSYDGFDRLYDQLKIAAFEKYIPESEVSPLGIQITNKGLKEGIFEISDGATVFKGEEHGLHTRVFINSAGLPTYEAKDLGLAAKKWQDYKFDINVIITANEIEQYMQVVLEALNHFYPEAASQTQHLTHGMVKLPGGIKMSSRKGNILLANDILDAATRANQMAGRAENNDTVLAAVKYAFIKQRIGGDIIYDPEESVSLHGNSGPYLQYAHARARSILAKADIDAEVSINELGQGERRLVRKLGEYSFVVEQATAELMPHHICTYLYELSQVFNRFYEQNRVIGDAREAIRLTLVKRYADILKAGLDLLNIPAPESM